MRHNKLLSVDRSVLLVVDIQDAFAKHIHEMDRVITRSCVMIKAAQTLQLPVIVTEQYPDGLGETVAKVAEVLGQCTRYDKVAFSCCQDKAVKEALLATGRNQVLLVGIEAHVCILQTCYDLMALDLQPYVAVDAVSSRRPEDMRIAFDRLGNDNVVLTTTEAAIMEMTASSKHPAFREISKIIK
jgi:isochorismate hydrolase